MVISGLTILGESKHAHFGKRKIIHKHHPPTHHCFSLRVSQALVFFPTHCNPNTQNYKRSKVIRCQLYGSFTYMKGLKWPRWNTNMPRFYIAFMFSICTTQITSTLLYTQVATYQKSPEPCRCLGSFPNPNLLVISSCHNESCILGRDLGSFEEGQR